MSPTTPYVPSPLLRALYTIMVAVFLAPVVAYLCCGSLRMTCPFELEWMEGGSLQMMQRILAGEPLYGPPTVEFVPYTYTPLYFYISAFASAVLPGEFLPLRAVSFLASLASFGFLFLIIRRETGSATAGAGAVGLFAATYAANGNWFDLARIDSLCISLLLAAAWLVLGGKETRNVLLGGAVVALAFLTKQVAIVVAGPLFVAVLLRNVKRGIVLFLSALSVLGGAILFLNSHYDGWFLFYTLTSPRTRWLSNLSWESLGKAAFLEFFPLFIIPLALATPAVWRILIRPHAQGLSFLMVVGGFFLAAAWGRIESINFLNSSIPAHVAVSLLFGLAVGDIVRRTARIIVPVSLTGAFALQLGILAPLIGPLIPHEKELSNFTQYSSFLASLPKPVYLPDHGYVPSLGPESSFAHSIGIMDLMMGGTPQQVSEFRGQMEEALNARRFKTIVCDTHLYPTWFKEALARNYTENTILAPKGTWIPVLGFQAQPTIFTAR